MEIHEVGVAHLPLGDCCFSDDVSCTSFCGEQVVLSTPRSVSLVAVLWPLLMCTCLAVPA